MAEPFLYSYDPKNKENMFRTYIRSNDNEKDIF